MIYFNTNVSNLNFIKTEKEGKMETRAAKIAKLIVELKKLGAEPKMDFSEAAELEAETEPEVKDETKGEVTNGEEEKETEENSEATVIEIAPTGKGFAIYRDYAKLDKGKYKRLTR